MITLYLDMDGVVADFHKAYYAGRVRDGTWDKVRFREMVMQQKIFEDLDKTPDADQIFNHAKLLQKNGINVEMLTSVGTFDPFQGEETKRQKTSWLRSQGIDFRMNFVRTKSEKANYATPYTLLVDDSVGCVTPFTIAGGHGILHFNAADSMAMVDTIILQIRALEGLRKDA